MKTKEEIFSKYFHPVTEEDWRLKRSIFDFAEEVADLQTEQLKKELGEKDKEIERLNSNCKNLESINSDKHLALSKEYVKTDSLTKQVKDLQSKLSEKDKELSELKAKHKEDVIKAYGQPRVYFDDEFKQMDEITAEQYYTQTHGQ